MVVDDGLWLFIVVYDGFSPNNNKPKQTPTNQNKPQQTKINQNKPQQTKINNNNYKTKAALANANPPPEPMK